MILNSEIIKENVCRFKKHLYLCEQLKNHKIMNNEMTQLLRELSDKLGTNVEHLWGVMIKQASVQVWTNIFFVIFTVIITWIFVYFFKKIYKSDTWDKAYQNDTEFGLIFSAIVVGFGTLILVVLSIIFLFEIPTLIYNPEYWALEQIIK